MEVKKDGVAFKKAILEVLREFNIELRNPATANVQINIVRGEPSKVQIEDIL